jgi:hypothetical protein
MIIINCLITALIPLIMFAFGIHGFGIELTQWITGEDIYPWPARVWIWMGLPIDPEFHKRRKATRKYRLRIYAVFTATSAFLLWEIAQMCWQGP